MSQQPMADEAQNEPEAATPSPLRGLLIAVPVGLALWAVVVEVVRLLV